MAQVYGEDIAILAGDALLTYSFEHIARDTKGCPADRVLRVGPRGGGAGKVGGEGEGAEGGEERGPKKGGRGRGEDRGVGGRGAGGAHTTAVSVRGQLPVFQGLSDC